MQLQQGGSYVQGGPGWEGRGWAGVGVELLLLPTNLGQRVAVVFQSMLHLAELNFGFTFTVCQFYFIFKPS